MIEPKEGLFNVDKAAGMTSMEVVRQIKRLSSQRHIGHGGTLDPEATGVLPVFLGQATRLMQFLVDGDKEYITTVRLGITTDTYDRDGRVLQECDSSSISREEVMTALDSMRGVIEQIPPMYSALKHQGRRLHELARAGINVDRAPRIVRVMRLDLVGWDPPLVTLSVHCSRGVYIRSMAHDLGEVLGCGAHVAELRRVRTGPFHVDDAVTLEQLKEALRDGSWGSMFYPPDHVLLHMGTVVLNRTEEIHVRNGQAAPLDPRTHYSQHMEARRAYSTDGRFVAIVRFNSSTKLWQPFKVFQLSTPSPYKMPGGLTPDI
jgi:tRNA pseudouridine55 synthase